MSKAPGPGEVLAGKYRIERVLGQGGMGVVVEARHLQLDERVAMKFLLPEYAQHPEASARFLREARAAVKIKSEHVARVVDVGTLESGAPYMVMEFLQGRDLSQDVAHRGGLPVEEAVEFILQACEAIAEAHAQGIVHRDLKPANLFLTHRADGSPSVKVLDFGISKVTVPTESGPDMSLTKTSAMMGSPLYMAPEQMRSSRDADARSDIWSLGAILFELLTGRPPFDAESLPELCAKILTEKPPPLNSLRADLPKELDEVVGRCLERDREARFSNVAELAVALVPFAPKRARGSAERVSRVLTAAGISRSDFSLAALGSTVPPAGTATAWGQTAGGVGKKRNVALASAAAVAVVAAGLAAVMLLGENSGEQIQQPGALSEVPPSPPMPPATAAPLPARAEPTAPAEPAASTAVHEAASAAANSPPAESSAQPVVAAKSPRRPVKARPAPKPTSTAKPQPTTSEALFGDRK
jgi:serine/threonine-protein kinase